MNFSVRDYQGRVNGILGESRLIIDGMSGPKTRAAIQEACKLKNVKQKQDLFNRGVRGIVWHWTAGSKGLIELELNSYNFLHDVEGNTYDGKATIAEQVMYDWRRGVGVSHTRSMNTGWIGQSVDAMAGAKQTNPITWGTNPITWKGLDAMLEQSADLVKEYDIPVSKWTTLSHAEVQPTLGVTQKWKWDYVVLPGDTVSRDPVEIGDILRKRLMEKFL